MYTPDDYHEHDHAIWVLAMIVMACFLCSGRNPFAGLLLGLVAFSVLFAYLDTVSESGDPPSKPPNSTPTPA